MNLHSLSDKEDDERRASSFSEPGLKTSPVEVQQIISSFRS